jgi:predicted transcriptional regulator of viral defense system
MFTPTQIRLAWEILQHKGWLSRVKEGTRDARE